MSTRSDVIAALLGAISAVWFVASLEEAKVVDGPNHPWNVQLKAERRCINGVHRSVPMPASFKFRHQGDSMVGGDKWQTSFRFTTTEADGKHIRHTAECELSLEERRGTALVTRAGKTHQESIQFIW